MARSLRVRKDCIEKIKSALLRNGYCSQGQLAEHVGLTQGTVSNFLNGKPVDWKNFQLLCDKLGQTWQDIIDLDTALEEPTQPDANELTTTGQNPVQTKPSEDFNERVSEFLNDNTPSYPPQPVPDLALEYPEGLVKPGSLFYIDRPPNEERCYQTLKQPGALIRIRAPRQWGKTSLLARILQQAEQQGDRVIYLSLQLLESTDLTSPKTFIQWFCTQITEELQLSEQLNQFKVLATTLSSKSACEKYFERYLLPQLEQPLTLVLDEVDQVFETPDIYKSFFSLLRVMHEKGKISSIWQRLRLVIAHSTEVYVQVDPNQSPFNVGVSILLPEFTATQVQHLAQRHHLPWTTSEIEPLMNMVGGHPFLLRLAMYQIACQENTLDQVLQSAPSETGIYSEHLRRLSDLLNQQPDLASAMGKVATAESPVTLTSVTRAKLQSLGLVEVQGNKVTPSCELYRRYFCDR